MIANAKAVCVSRMTIVAPSRGMRLAWVSAPNAALVRTMALTPETLQGANPYRPQDVAAVSVKIASVAKIHFVAITSGMMFVPPNATKIATAVNFPSSREVEIPERMVALPRELQGVMDANVKTAFVHSMPTVARLLGMKPVCRNARMNAMAVGGPAISTKITWMVARHRRPRVAPDAIVNNAFARSTIIAAPTLGMTSA